MTRDNPLWNVLGALGLILSIVVGYVAPSPQDYGLSPIIVRWLVIVAAILTAMLKFANSPWLRKGESDKVDVRKITPVILLCLMIPALTGCAESRKAKLQQIDRSLVGTLQLLDTTEEQMFADKTVDEAFHKKFSGYMYTALSAGETFHKSVMAYKPGTQPLPVDVIMLTSAMRSAADLVRSLPASDKRDKIAAIIDTVALIANQILSIILPPQEADALMPVSLVYAGGH